MARQTVPASRYRPYPRYRDSGVEWLGQIPVHWEVMRLRHVFSILNGSTPDSRIAAYWDGDIPWVTPEDLGDLKVPVIQSTRRHITEAGYRSCGTTLAPAGSLVLSTRAPIGHVAIAGVSLCTNQGCRCLVFRRPSVPKFFYFQLIAARTELESWGQGSTFKELSRAKLADISLAVPPKPEQDAIAAFLDRETAKIDSLVAKKERLVELLQEKRTALITQAVTKGLNPSVPMKDSSVEWLGGIPSHWEVTLVKRVASIRYGLSQPPRERAGGLPFIRATNISRGTIVEHDMKFVDPDSIPENRDAFVATGDIIVVRSGAYTGDSAIIPPKYNGAVAGYDMIVRPLRVVPKFLAWALLSSYVLSQIELERTRAAQPHLNADQLGGITVLLPPEPEQHAIAAFLDRETAKIDALIAKIREGIVRLKEYRTALISAAVTGKIDVRHELGPNDPD